MHMYICTYIYFILLFICSWCDVLPDFINLINVDVDVDVDGESRRRKQFLKKICPSTILK